MSSGWRTTNKQAKKQGSLKKKTKENDEEERVSIVWWVAPLWRSWMNGSLGERNRSLQQPFNCHQVVVVIASIIEVITFEAI